jgi:hypothetical protein
MRATWSDADHEVECGLWRLLEPPGRRGEAVAPHDIRAGFELCAQSQARIKKRGGGLTPSRVASAQADHSAESSYFGRRSASIRSVVAGWFAKKPPPLVPSVCMSQVSVAGMMSGDIPAFWRISMPWRSAAYSSD